MTNAVKHTNKHTFNDFCSFLPKHFYLIRVKGSVSLYERAETSSSYKLLNEWGTNTGFHLWEQAKTHFSVAIYTKWTPVVKIPLQNGTEHPTEPVLLHALLKQEVEGLSLAVCWTVLKCLFEFTCLCNGVGVNIGCQSDANDRLKIYKGEQSPDVIHVYCKLIFTVPVIIREQ